jgi:hypothetical protein
VSLLRTDSASGSSELVSTFGPETIGFTRSLKHRHAIKPRFRLKGLLLLSGRNLVESEACFERAMRIAQRQGAKSLELRAAVSLARLCGEQGRRRKAHELLAPVYGWFTEGFDTADLKEAAGLLASLA